MTNGYGSVTFVKDNGDGVDEDGNPIIRWRRGDSNLDNLRRLVSGKGSAEVRWRRAESDSVRALSKIAAGKPYGVLHNQKYGEIQYPLGHSGKGGVGFLHIVEHRMNGGASLDETIQTAVNVGVAAEIGTKTASILNTRHFEYNGTRAIVAIQNNNIVATRYEIDADENAAAIRRAAERNPHPHVGSDEVIGRLRKILSQSPSQGNVQTEENSDHCSAKKAQRVSVGW